MPWMVCPIFSDVWIRRKSLVHTVFLFFHFFKERTEAQKIFQKNSTKQIHHFTPSEIIGKNLHNFQKLENFYGEKRNILSEYFGKILRKNA